MDLRARIHAALKSAEAEQDTRRAATLRLVLATFRDRELARRATGAEAAGTPAEAGEEELRAILSRLAAQRRESAEALELAGRLQQAADKTAEVEAIEAFLPRRMSPAEIAACIDGAVAEAAAQSLRDIGRVMAALRPRLADQLDPAELKAQVRARLLPEG